MLIQSFIKIDYEFIYINTDSFKFEYGVESNSNLSDIMTSSIVLV